MPIAEIRSRPFLPNLSTIKGVTVDATNIKTPVIMADSSGFTEPPALSKIDCALNRTTLIP